MFRLGGIKINSRVLVIVREQSCLPMEAVGAANQGILCAAVRR